MLRTSAIGERAPGFTLIELLVVMAILVMVTCAFPLVLQRLLPRHRVVALTQKIVVAIDATRDASTICSCPLTLQLQSRLFGLAAADRDRLSRPLTALSIPSSTQVVLMDMDAIRIDSLKVFPDGTASAARFEIADGVQRSAITLSELTGRVQVSWPGRRSQ